MTRSPTVLTDKNVAFDSLLRLRVTYIQTIWLLHSMKSPSHRLIHQKRLRCIHPSSPPFDRTCSSTWHIPPEGQGNLKMTILIDRRQVGCHRIVSPSCYNVLSACNIRGSTLFDAFHCPSPRYSCQASQSNLMRATRLRFSCAEFRQLPFPRFYGPVECAISTHEIVGYDVTPLPSSSQFSMVFLLILTTIICLGLFFILVGSPTGNRPFFSL